MVAKQRLPRVKLNQIERTAEERPQAPAGFVHPTLRIEAVPKLQEFMGKKGQEVELLLD